MAMLPERREHLYAQFNEFVACGDWARELQEPVVVSASLLRLCCVLLRRCSVCFATCQLLCVATVRALSATCRERA